MKGAIAAGHPLTAEAGARVLEAGGSAVDACVGAALVSWVCESPLTGPGGGGFMLVHEARSGRTGVLDFFVAVPREAAAGELLERAVDFDGDTQELFRTGAAAVAVPGTALGLEEAHRRFGRLPWAELVEPAARLARKGFEVTPTQAYLHGILDPLLRHSPEGDAMYGVEGRSARVGERLAFPELAATLERLAEEGASVVYTGDCARAIVEHVQAGGGALQLSDLADYRLVRRRPVSVAYRGHEFRSNPPPSSGGVLVGVGLQALGDVASTPGERLTSMMAPSIVLREGRPRLVVGSAGSARLRGAILQVIANVVAGGMGVDQAVEAPRVHAESGVVHCESPPAADALEAEGRAVVRWRERNLYFGGASAVEVLDGGAFTAAGDPRRGGGSVVVA